MGEGREQSGLARRRAGLAAHAIPCCLGLALLVALDWSRELVIPTAGVVMDSPTTAVSNVCAIAALLVCAALHERFERLIAGVGPGGWVALGVACAAGRFLATFGLGLGLPVWLGYAGVALYAVGEAVLLLAWLFMCCRDAVRDAVVILPAAYAVAAAAHFVLRAVDPWIVGGLAVVLPLLSAGVLGWCAGSHPGSESEETRPAGGDAPDAPTPGKGAPLPGEAPAFVPQGQEGTGTGVGAGATAALDGSQAWSFPVRPVVLMAAYSFVFYFSLAFSTGPNPYGSLGMLLVALGTFAAVEALPRFRPSALYRFALPLMVAGLMSLAFLDGVRTIAVMLTNSANVAFTLFMLITLCEMCGRYGMSPTWMFGVVYATSHFAGMVGMPLGAAFVEAFPVGSQQAHLVMCVIVVGVVVLSTIFFNDQVVARSFGMVPAGASVGGATGQQAAMSYSERVVWQCARVGRRFGLTQREQEVLELLVQGVPASEIAEKASISYGTVKTHVNHIYRKLDVHSRDEALAVVRACE